MGQKVNPHGLRVGVNKDWNSKWYAGKNDFADFLIEDQQIRSYVKKTLYAAGVASVVVERPAAQGKSCYPGCKTGNGNRQSRRWR